MDSDDYADAVLAMRAQQQQDESEQRRTMLGYSTVLDALYNIADRLGALYAVTIAVNTENGQAPEVPPMPRPQTSFDRMRDKSFLRRHRNRVAMLTGRVDDG